MTEESEMEGREVGGGQLTFADFFLWGEPWRTLLALLIFHVPRFFAFVPVLAVHVGHHEQMILCFCSFCTCRACNEKKKTVGASGKKSRVQEFEEET